VSDVIAPAGSPLANALDANPDGSVSSGGVTYGPQFNPNKAPTNRVTLKVGGYAFTNFTKVSIERDLKNISGRFELNVMDQARLAMALPIQIGDRPPLPVVLKAGQAAELAIDGEAVLIGWIGKPSGSWKADKISMGIAGRDKTGDLVECAALPNGPAEFRGVDLLHVAQVVCAPFGITVRADVDIGAPFVRLSLHKHETALAFLEKAARQRAILLVSDGVGGLLLTRGGSSRAPDDLVVGGNVQEAQFEDDWDERFSDYFVVGQTDQTAQRAGVPVALDSTVVPLTDAPTPATAPGPASAKETSSILMTGHAIDPEITRWRPTVRQTRSQSGMSSVQEQAEWMLRVARGQAEKIRYTVLDWRAGPDNALWRPNQVAYVYDPFAERAKDMLIAGVTYLFDAEGERTELRVVGVTAYDRINEADRQRGKKPKTGAASGAPLDSTVTPLTAG
jgi:prophage tail gpP-like protein